MIPFDFKTTKQDLALINSLGIRAEMKGKTRLEKMDILVEAITKKLMVLDSKSHLVLEDNHSYQYVQNFMGRLPTLNIIDSRLFESIKQGDTAEAELCLRRGADVNSIHATLTPYLLAGLLWGRDSEMAKLLAEQGGKVDKVLATEKLKELIHPDSYGQTESVTLRKISDLLAWGADVNATAYFVRHGHPLPIIYHAVAKQSPECVKLILDAPGLDYNHVDERHGTVYDFVADAMFRGEINDPQVTGKILFLLELKGCVRAKRLGKSYSPETPVD